MKTGLILLVLSVSLSSAQLKVSADGHYLTEQDGAPVFLVGVAPWDISNNRVRYADLMQEINSCVAHHLNFWQMRLPSPANFGGPANGNGANPWIGTQTFASTPNESYWKFIDTILAETKKHGIYIEIYPDYLGGDASQGWQTETGNSSLTVMYNWGRFVGNRYKDSTNIIWGIGGDYPPTAYQAKLDTMAKGIRSFDTHHLMSTRDEQGTTTDTYWGPSYRWKTLAGIYPYWNSYQPQLIYSEAWSFYNRTPVQPPLGQEFWYENEHNTTTQPQLRQQIWYCALSGLLAGEVFGNCPEWNFGANSVGFSACASTTWQAELNSQGHIAQKVFAEIFTVRHWWKLVPDTTFVVADSGYGTVGDGTFCPTSHASDSSCIMTFLPSQHRIRIKLGYVKGGSVACMWYNPATGAVTNLGNKPPVTTTFIPPSSGDWVFVADAIAQTVPSPPVLQSPGNGAIGVSTSPTMTWSVSAGATSYRLQVSQDSSFGATVVDQAGIVTTSFVATGLLNSRSYYWRVDASNSGGTSGYSAAWRFTTAASTTVQIPLVDQWNLVSVPVIVGDHHASVLFPTAISPAFGFVSGLGYNPSDSLSDGKGYWMKFVGTQTVGVTGLAQTRDTIGVGSGWNIIGSISSAVDTSAIQSIPPGIRISPFYEYSSGFTVASMISPGKGYWVRTNTAGYLILPAGNSGQPSMRETSGRRLSLQQR